MGMSPSVGGTAEVLEGTNPFWFNLLLFWAVADGYKKQLLGGRSALQGVLSLTSMIEERRLRVYFPF